jgi:hypothetical protein
MAEVKQTDIPVEVITKCVEQKFGSTVALTGVLPTLAAAPFAPYVGSDGITRMKQADTPANDEADAGGLFTLNHQQPAILEEVRIDFSSSVAYTVAIVTTAGEYTVNAGTAQFVNITPRAFIMPGESVKVTAAGPTGKPWVRIYVRSDQARH